MQPGSSTAQAPQANPGHGLALDSPGAPVVVFAIGNPSRGDDALGPHLLARLAAWLEGEGRGEGFELVEDFQLQIEHVLDLEGRELALFIDAGTGTPAPYTFSAVQPLASRSHTSHALVPAAVLQVFHQINGVEPPPAFVLCVRGESFELGAGLSAVALAHAEAAWALLEELCRDPDAAAWAARADGDTKH